MSFGKINLRLPKPGELKLAESISTRASLPSDDVELTPNSNQNPFITDPLPERPKSLQSSETLKNCLKRTSEKLKNYSFLSSSTSLSSQTSEILRLQQRIEELEHENKQLQFNNKIVTEKLHNIEEIPEQDEDLSKILKYAQFFVAKVKRNPAYIRSFSEIFQSEQALVAGIKADKLKKTVKDLFLFSLENLQEKSEGPSFRSQSTTREANGRVSRELGAEEMLKIHRKSDTLVQNISEQKIKIQKIYEDLKVSVDRSKMVMNSELGSRKRNPFSCMEGENDFSVNKE